ncbi:MAG: hypothetical protein HN623_00085 [Bdellovibrionales bacterium]|nr:hypothetical protein [Bdellovibrionales bacterium]
MKTLITTKITTVSLLLTLMICLCPTIWGKLPVDSKFIARIINLSGSRKSMLINRGLDHGLSINLHAKLSNQGQYFGRAAMIKAPPTRSVWYLYETKDSKPLYVDNIITIKIASAVKVTIDPDRLPPSVPSLLPPSSLQQTSSNETQRTAQRLNLKQTDGHDILPPKRLSAEELDKLMLSKRRYFINMDSQNNSKGQGRGIFGTTSELWGQLALQVLSSSYDNNQNSVNSGDNSSFELQLGYERLLNQQFSSWKDISLLATTTLNSQRLTVMNGSDLSTTSFEVGGGLNWHFNGNPLAFNQRIPFFATSYAWGITKSGDKSISSTFTIGLGLKLYSSQGHGIRLLLDYYYRTSSVSNQGSSRLLTSGPRLHAGLSYRW